MSLLGIDVGTSGCKAGIFSEDGRLLGLAYAEYDYQHARPGWAELDSAQVWLKIKQTIGRAAASAAADPPRALCVSSLGESLVPVSADRRILGFSQLNFDSRGAEYLGGLQSQMQDEPWYRINGNLPGNQYSLTKLMWLKEHRPGLYRQADHFLYWSGLVAFMLGAEARVDPSLANRSLLFDLERGDWSDELVGLSGIDREKLPAIVPAGTVIGAVAGPMAEEVGLTAGIPIVNGGQDQCCSGIGCGVIQPGQAMYGMGTYLCMMPVFDRRPEPSVMIERGLNTEHHVVPGQYVSFIYNQGGVLVKWFRDTFASAEHRQADAAGQDIYTALMAEMPEGPSKVMVLPHFTVTGPPQFIADSCGVIAGLKLDMPRGTILKGILEGSTFYLRQCFETLPGAGIAITDFRAVGGGSKSDAWVQLCADILGRPFIRPRINEAGVLGTAILAGTGCGVFPSLKAGVETMVRLDRQFDPDPVQREQYEGAFDRYRRLWPLMADYLRELAA